MQRNVNKNDKNDPCDLDLDLSESSLKKQKMAPPTVTQSKIQTPKGKNTGVETDNGGGKKKKKKKGDFK